jgi:hypothetical protein
MKDDTPVYVRSFRLWQYHIILQACVPFLVNGEVNPAVPNAPGVYFLFGEEGEPPELLYIGKSESSLQRRLQAYRQDHRFILVAWHEVDAHDAGAYELLYIREYAPAFNGSYHRESESIWCLGQWLYVKNIPADYLEAARQEHEAHMREIMMRVSQRLLVGINT